MDIEYKGFPKIPRLSRECIVTEKIDGTLGCVIIEPFNARKTVVDNLPLDVVSFVEPPVVLSWTDMGIPSRVAPVDRKEFAIYAGSKNRLVYPGKQDNYGFAGWVLSHVHQLVFLGPGRHFGEWWGQGIQRGYGLKEKRFSLFNTSRWSNDLVRPACCHVVPVLYTGMFDDRAWLNALTGLRIYGSAAVPGYKNPEGIVIFHTALNGYFKKTLENDDVPKSKGETKC